MSEAEMDSTPDASDASDVVRKKPKPRGIPVAKRKAGGAGRAGKRGSIRANKYNAAGERIDGIWFHSQAEARRYEQLKELAEKGVIDNLRHQVKLPCLVNNKLICTYIADFAYVVIDDRGTAVRSVWEDVKGMVTDVYKIKKKLVEAIHHIDIVEVPGNEVPQWAGRTG